MTAGAPHLSEAGRPSPPTAARLLGAAPPAALGGLLRLAARLSGATAAAVLVSDAQGVIHLASHGWPSGQAEHDAWLCEQVIARAVASGDSRSPIIISPASPARPWCAGVPLLLGDTPVGALCVLDKAARPWSDVQTQTLQDLAQTVGTVMEAQLVAHGPLWAEEHRLFLSGESPEHRGQERDVRILRQVLQADQSLGLMVIEGAPMGWQVAYANPACAQMLGMPHPALPGHPLPTVLDHLIPLGSSRGELQRALQLGTPCVALMATPSHTVPGRILEMRLTPLQDRDGDVGLFMGLLHDVTERQAAAEKLRVSEELYRCVAATISDGLLVVQLNGNLVAVNPAGARILGIPADEVPSMLGQPLSLELLAEDLETPLPRQAWPWQQTIHSGHRLTNQLHALRRPDGEIAWIQLSCHLLSLSVDAPPFAAVATFRDITQERQAARALAQSEERWKFALEGAGEGVWDWELGLSRVYYSPRWKSMLGHEDAEISSHPSEWIERIHPEDRFEVVHQFMDYCQSGRGIFQAEFRLKHKDGHFLWILCRGKVVSHESDGRPLRVVGTHLDITPLKQAERAMRDKASAEAASQAKSEFVSRMSHEIRTPLNAVRGFAQLLSQHPAAKAPGEVREYVQQILHSSALLGELVNDVLDLQQIESGAVAVMSERVPLGPLVRQCVAMLEPMAAARAVLLNNRVPEDGLNVRGDRRRLQQVLANLLSNAIKYNRQGGSVTVQCGQEPGGHTVIDITDTGLGMDAHQLSRLFQPFERLGKDTSQIEGTGLGLIITRSLVEAMGGRLEIRSQPGEGTRVAVSLPYADESHDVTDRENPTEVAEPPALTPQESMSAGGGACTDASPLRVMYVEDNRINALLFQEALRPYTELLLEVAEDGQAALALARELRPEVLVIDAHLPGMSGFEVLRALRTLPGLQHVPAYMCSADALPEDIERARDEGFVGYWTKPIDIQEVTAELTRLAQLGHNGAP